MAVGLDGTETSIYIYGPHFLKWALNPSKRWLVQHPFLPILVVDQVFFHTDRGNYVPCLVYFSISDTYFSLKYVCVCVYVCTYMSISI